MVTTSSPFASAFSSPTFGGTPAVPNLTASGSTPAVLSSNTSTPSSFNFATTPAVPSIPKVNFSATGQPIPQTAPQSPLSMGTIKMTPAVPNVPTTPAIPGTTPAAIQQNPSTQNSAIVTTPSGAQVNQYTGALINPAPVSSTNMGSTPTVPNSIFGSATTALNGAGTGTQPVTPAVQGLTSLAATNPANSGPGVSGYDTAVNNLANFESSLQTQLGNTGKQAIPMPFIQGQQQVENTENSGILSALSNAVTQAQTGVQLGEAGTQIQETGLNEAGTLANAGQNTAQNALTAAASATQPVAGASFFGTPETGGMVGTGSAAMQSAVALQAEKLQNGTTDPASAAAALSAYGQAGTNALQAALGPNFSIPGATGAAAATESNTALSGTATPTAENAVYQQATTDYANLQQAVSNVSGLGSTLVAGMTDSSGNTINPTASKWANMTISQVENQLSSPSQAQFKSTLAALQAKVSGMLSIGGNETPTQLTSDANSIIDGSAPLGTLQATLDRIQSEGNTLLTTQANKVNTAKSNITPPSSNLGTNSGSSSSAAPAGWNW